MPISSTCAPRRRELLKRWIPFKIIVTKSTVPVGTADQIQKWIAEETAQPFAVVSNPEFLKEGAAVEDFMKPDRVVLGGDHAEALEAVKELYEPFVRTGNPILIMDSRSAEMSKYASNAMLATKISFINEVARLCEQMNADIGEVRRAISLDRRIGPHFIFPGVGYGGSCFPKDIRAMIGMGGDDPEMVLAQGRGSGQRAAKGTAGRKGQTPLRRRSCPGLHSLSGGSPSSREPTTCAMRRRSP